MGAHKSFIVKRKLGKAGKQNRRVPWWLSQKFGKHMQNPKMRYWRRTKLGY